MFFFFWLDWLIEGRYKDGLSSVDYADSIIRFLSRLHRRKKSWQSFFCFNSSPSKCSLYSRFSIELSTDDSRSAYLCTFLIIMFRWITATHATGSKSKSMAKSKYSLFLPQLNSVHDAVTSIEPLLKTIYMDNAAWVVSWLNYLKIFGWNTSHTHTRRLIQGQLSYESYFLITVSPLLCPMRTFTTTWR